MNSNDSKTIVIATTEIRTIKKVASGQIRWYPHEMD